MAIVNTNGFDMSQILPLLGGIGALGGGLAQAGAQNNSASLAQQYAAQASQLGGFGLGTGPGGVGATGNPLGGGGNLNFGNFNPAYQGLASLTGSNVGTAGGIGAPNGLGAGLQGAFGTAAGGLAGFNPSAPGMAGNADLSAAAGLAGGLGGGFGQQVTNQYNALQALQSPANINAANSLGNSLFGRGMLGSSSGGILSQQFGQGLAQQSAANAAQATGLGIQALGTQANAATGLTWMGSNALNSAFSNFNNASMLAPNVQSSYLNPAMAGITGAGNLTNTGLGLYNAGLQSALGQNQASARAGYLGTTNANSPNQQSPYGQLLGNMFGGLATGGNPSGGGILQQILGGGQNNSGGILGQLFGYNGPMSGPNGGFPLSSGNIASAYGGGPASFAGYGGPSAIDPNSLSGFSDYFGGGGAPSAFDTSVNSDLSTLFGGPSAAGGEAAGAGAVTDTSTAFAPTGGIGGYAAGGSPFSSAAGAGATGDAAAASSAVPEVGAGVAAAGLGAMLAIAAHQNPTALNQNYWNGINSTLAGGPGSGVANYGANNALAPIAQSTQYRGALADVFNAYANQGMGNSTIPNSEWQTLAGYGITPQNINTLGMPDMGMAYWQNLSANSGVPMYSTPSRQGL